MFGIKTMVMNSFQRLRTPSTDEKLLPPPAGGPPPSRREVWGFAGQGLRPCRRLDIGALRSPLSPFARPLEGLLEHRGRTGAQCAPLRCTAVQPTVANASNRCNDATQRCKHISQLQFPADILPTPESPPPRPPSSREGDRPQAVEGVNAGGGRSKRRRWKEYPPPPFSHISDTISSFCVRIRAVHYK